MAEDDTSGGAEGEAPAKKSKLPMIIGLVLALAGGGGGFFAVSSGMILGSEPEHEEEPEEEVVQVEPLNNISFVAIDPLIVNLVRGGHLRFVANLEVVQEHEADVTLLLPRVLDVLNNYLRAVDVNDLNRPGALVQLRAQMLRRVQIVTGEGRVRDLLVTEFVLN